MLFCSVNGQSTSHISITDRAFNYGDGLFTTALIQEHHVQWLASHIERLKKGCEALAIKEVNWSWLTEEMTTIASHFSRAVLKVVITAGEGGRGYSRKDVSRNNIIITVSSYPEHYDVWREQGLQIGCSNLRLSHGSILSGIKHLNRLEQVMIRQELDRSDYDELLVTDVENRLVEASCANVFWLEHGQWFTPQITNAGISGIYRKQLLNSFSAIKEVRVELSALANIEAMFICNCVMGALPVHSYQGKMLSIEKCTELSLDLTR